MHILGTALRAFHVLTHLLLGTTHDIDVETEALVTCPVVRLQIFKDCTSVFCQALF